jgi:hypothetical protein
MTLGYTLPTRIVSKAWAQSLRVYVGVEKLITWDHLGDLPIDPDQIDGYSCEYHQL